MQNVAYVLLYIIKIDFSPYKLYCPAIFSLYNISMVPDQNGISQACYIIKIYHSGPEPSINRLL